MIESLQREFGMQGSLKIVSGKGGLPQAVLTHRSGAGAEVYLHGGHVTSWYTPDGRDVFFLSRESQFAPGKPIRGGIPVCFPQFGGKGPLPQHGFARTSEWQLVRTELLDNGIVTAELQLSETPDTLAMWPHQFALGLRVLLDEMALTVVLQAVNTGTQPLEFQAVLHTYFAVEDITRTAVRGLEGVQYVDALQEDVRRVEDRDAIRFVGETDRVYFNAPDQLQLDDEGNARTITIQTRAMPDAVVWNPWIDKSRRMADFGDDEYLQMVCVETGRIAAPVALDPEERWEGATTFCIHGC